MLQRLVTLFYILFIFNRGHRCISLKKRNCKYILGKSMPPYINLSLFLINSSKNYISYPKKLIKSVATMAFGRKVSQGSSFKKDSQFNSNFSTSKWCCSCAASQTFLSHWLTMSYWTHWYYDIKLPLFSKTKLNSFSICRKKLIFNLSFFVEYTNLDYIHWADITRHT